MLKLVRAKNVVATAASRAILRTFCVPVGCRLEKQQNRVHTNLIANLINRLCVEYILE